MAESFFLGSWFMVALLLPTGGSDACLPKGVHGTDVVSTSLVTSRDGRKQIKKVTVEQMLKQIRARCRKGKLVDRTGKEIYFYQLQGCWGNPPADYQEILSEQQRELRSLGKRYRVIEMTCNPSGEMIF